METPEPTQTPSDRERAAIAEERCPNCYDPIRGASCITPTGIRVCCVECVEGWMRGERSQKYLEIVSKLGELLAA